MYYRVDRSPGTVRVVESHKDELTEAVFFGALGLLALNVVEQNLPTIFQGEGIARGLLIGVAFASVFLLSTAFSSGIGRLARGLGRGHVIEVDLKEQRYRRYQHRWLFRKVGGDWHALSEPAQGAKLVWKGPRTQTALRLGQGRTFFFVTEPGEIGEELDRRLVRAVNQELAARGVASPETAAPPERRRATWRARWRDAWEYLSIIFIAFLFVSFLYSLFLVALVLERM